MSEVTLCPAKPEHVPSMKALLDTHHLPTVELEDWLEHFVVAYRGGRLIGCGGLELYAEDSAGLVRSMAVESDLQGTGVGGSILGWVEEHASELGLRRLFLFTVEAAPFYERFGYELVDYDAFPPSARSSFQYRVVRERGEEWGVIAMAKDV
ncbi:MAG: GNAT family N-acetyltransferase [Chloroflexi bacterium]|nr:GNAT family N-acetyltransferase [Chloroflexota bacterium]